MPHTLQWYFPSHSPFLKRLRRLAGFEPAWHSFDFSFITPVCVAGLCQRVFALRSHTPQSPELMIKICFIIKFCLWNIWCFTIVHFNLSHHSDPNIRLQSDNFLHCLLNRNHNTCCLTHSLDQKACHCICLLVGCTYLQAQLLCQILHHQHNGFSPPTLIRFSRLLSLA